MTGRYPWKTGTERRPTGSARQGMLRDERTVAESTRGREAAQRRVPRPLLERYRALVEAGRSPALVAVERGTCSGCHVRLPTMVEYKVAHSLGVYACPHCRRSNLRIRPENIGKRELPPVSTPEDMAAFLESSG